MNVTKNSPFNGQVPFTLPKIVRLPQIPKNNRPHPAGMLLFAGLFVFAYLSLGKKVRQNIRTMAVWNPDFDHYITKAQPFARPILEHIRLLVHRACPDVEETMKWSCPHFGYNGKILCSMAAFKQHATMGFWLGSRIHTLKPYEVSEGDGKAMGQLSRLTSVKDLPGNRELTAILKEAMALINAGATLKKASPKPAAELSIPEDFAEALARHKKARTAFDKFPPSHRKEYLQWITGAKTAATREKRMATALEWIAEGKGRNWKYE